MRCEVLIDPLMNKLGVSMLDAMVATAPMTTVKRLTYVGDCELLLSYGLGHPGRRPWIDAHVASGRHLIGFDVGYWNKGSKVVDRPMRLTLDQDHPQRWLVEMPAARFDSAGIELRNDYRADGPIVLVGLGPKTNVGLKQATLTWERQAFTKIRAAYPTTQIIYRPKRNDDGTSMPDTRKMAGMPIEVVLKGTSLVVCRHSNVGVDAAIAGIPVVCEDGVAAALYNNDLKNPVRPTYEQRLDFLRKVAWFQWQPTESKDCWAFILRRFEDRDKH